MIRRISLLLLLANTCVAFAQPLYKWTEADGSITFSPTPPTGGVEFEKLDAASPVAPELTARPDPMPAEFTNQPAASPTPAVALPRVEYAPGNSDDLPNAISRSPVSTLQPVNTGVAVLGPESSSPVDPDSDQSISNSAASYKQSRCQDLKKRVTSLERRLKSRLTPEDMDNTVLHMARYQRSYDQYCVQ